MRIDDPSLMTPEERLTKVAKIFAESILRLRARHALPCDNSQPINGVPLEINDHIKTNNAPGT